MAAAELGLTRRRRSRRLERVLVHAVMLGGLAGVIVAVQVVVLLVLGRLPTEEEAGILAVSTTAAAVTALLYQPARERLERAAPSLRPVELEADGEALATLAARLSRAIPLDELVLEIAQSLRRGLRLERAEVWTGSAGLLECSASDPDRGWATLAITPAEESVVARARVSGPAWLAVWLPALLEQRSGGPLWVAPLAHAGALLGLVVVERPPDGEPFGERDERALAGVARQAGVALRNVRLDSQLRETLDEVSRQAEQLRASRARVVSAADAERRRIERDLHDGAQQRLVALMAGVRLARELTGSDAAQATAVLEQIGRDLAAALEELRELAHGIYPPLLADRGLAHALAAVAARAPVPTRLETARLGRYPPAVEATVYFCCLEALQNAGKHARGATAARVRVWEEAGGLRFEVADDGPGFQTPTAGRGAGLESMTDRLGAIGGTLRIGSEPGHGARVTGTIPL